MTPTPRYTARRTEANRGDPLDVTVFYETSDSGKTWTFNEKYSLARIWADAGAYSFSITNYWCIWAKPDGSTGILAGDQQIGSISVLGYDTSKPITQFEGSNVCSFITKELEGRRYPAMDLVICRIPEDCSYEEDHYNYIVPKGSKYVYDIYLDNEWEYKIAEAVAKSFELNIGSL